MSNIPLHTEPSSTDLHWAHDTTCKSATVPRVCASPLTVPTTPLDYEQQRVHLLHKYGIDLEGGSGPSTADGTRTRRMDRKEVERLMGGGDGEGGIFTWREKNSRKVCCAPQSLTTARLIDRSVSPQLAYSV